MYEKYEYATKVIRNHPDGMKEHGWTNKDHERAMLKQAGLQGWELCAISSKFEYYFKRQIR